MICLRVLSCRLGPSRPLASHILLGPLFLLPSLKSTTLSSNLNLCLRMSSLHSFPTLPHLIVKAQRDSIWKLCSSLLTYSLCQRSKLLFRTYSLYWELREEQFEVLGSKCQHNWSVGSHAKVDKSFLLISETFFVRLEMKL